MGRKKKGRNRHGSGSIVDWYRGEKKVGRKGYLELPRGADGKRNRMTFYGKNDADVQAKMDAYREKLKAGIDLCAGKQTVEKYLTWWLEDVASLTVRPITLDSYEQKLHVHVYPVIGRLDLEDLRPDHLQSLYSAMVRKRLAKRTVQYVHAILHRAFKIAVKHRKLMSNPADAVDAPKPDRKEAAVVTPEQLGSMFKSLEGDWLYSLFYLAVATGMRRGELCALRWSDIDWDRPAIRVRKSTQELSKIKGGLIYADPKSQNGRRVVMLPDEAVAVLKLQKRQQSEMRLAKGTAWAKTDFVFTNEVGNGLRPSTVSNHWKSVRKAAGVPDVKFHGLRHTHATMLLVNGTQPKVVMERLGHSTISIGQDLYSHVLPTLQAEAKEKLNNLLPAANKATPKVG